MADSRSKRSLADPTRLPPFDRDDPERLVVIIETPKGSRNKYAFMPEEEIFMLKRVLPAGMSFPYDFGFVPSTLGGDGDPLDVLVLMDEPAFPGCRLTCRVIGIIEGEETKQERAEQNDRVVAVESANHSFAHVKHVSDLGATFDEEIEAFFVNYHRISGTEFRVLAMKGPSAAQKAIKRARKAARKKTKTQGG